MPEKLLNRVTIAKRHFLLSKEEVEQWMESVLPEPIASHYVVIGRHRYPPKQVITCITGVDRADFTTHQARRVLMGLGFPAGRRREESPRVLGGRQGWVGSPQPPVSAAATDPTGRRGELAETLRSFQGQWVAIKDDELLVATSSPKELVEWLARNDRRADSMFRVPDDELAFGGIAPL